MSKDADAGLSLTEDPSAGAAAYKVKLLARQPFRMHCNAVVSLSRSIDIVRPGREVKWGRSRSPKRERERPRSHSTSPLASRSGLFLARDQDCIRRSPGDSALSPWCLVCLLCGGGIWAEKSRISFRSMSPQCYMELFGVL